MITERHKLLAYALALVLPIGALLARVAIAGSTGDQNWAMLFIIPVTLCAYLGGACPGLLCTAFSVFLVGFFSQELQRVAGADLSMSAIQWITFVFAGCVISYLQHCLHNSQEAARRSEARLKGILDASLDAIVTLDDQYNVVYANPATEEMFGRSATQLAQTSILRLIPESEHERDLKILQSIADDEASRAFSSGPATGLRTNGVQFPVEATFSKVDVAGKSRYLLVLRDVSKHKAAEDALRQREALYRTLFESLEEGVVLWDANGCIEACNPAAERILGWKAKEIVGLHYSQVPWQPTGPGQAEFDPEKLSTAIIRRTGKALLLRERTLTRADGANIWILQNGIPLPSGSESTKPKVMITFSDITDRRRHIETLSQLADIVANSEDSIISKSLDGFIQTWNPGAVKMLGYTARDAIGQSFYNLLVPPELHAMERELRERIRNGRRSETFDITLLRKDGDPIEALVTASPLCDASDAVVGVSLIARDVTDRRRTEQALRERDAAEEASRLKSEFLATMSHELRTPLTGIIGFTEYLGASQAGPINAEQAESLDSILKSGLHLLDLINGILDLSRIEAGKMELIPETFVVREVVEEVCAVISPLAHKKQIAVKQRVTPAILTVTLDRAKFRQVLYNLLSNAVKFTDNDGQVAVDVNQLDGSRLIIHVTDNGIGIDPNDVEKLFQNFHQLDNSSSRRHEGAGLGLALTKKIVELQHGIITVESAPGRGSVFSVTLPIEV